MMIPEETIEQVRDSADIVDLIGEHVDLKRTGSDYRGPCPFHGGTHRNLAVIPRKQMFYCFVCHEGGDVFTFLMKHLGMEYPEAVREVARRLGISIPERSAPGPDPNEPLYSAVAAAGEWYARYLREEPDAQAAREYLTGRGFDPIERPELGFGFAPRGDAFTEGMHGLGITDEVLETAGLLVKREDGSLRPRFWNRVLIPIQDLRGRVVGFGGRVLGDGEPKYLNSPDSPIFHKGQLLYNLHHAKLAIRKEERAILVEGYFDVLALSDIGVENVVAALGTSFTERQAALIKRYTSDVIILYDSDSAGLRATFRAADEMLRAQLRVSVATMPEGEDPDTLAHSGIEAVRAVLRDAVDVLERKIQILEQHDWLSSISGRRRALDRLLPTLRAAGDPVTRDLYISRVAQALGASRESVAREVTIRSRGRKRPAPARVEAASEPRQRRDGLHPERSLCLALIQYPAWRGRIAEMLPDPSLLDEPAREVIERLARLSADQPPAALLDELEAPGRMLLSDVLEAPPIGDEDLDVFVVDALNRIEARKLVRERDELNRRMPFADPEEQREILRRKKEIGNKSWTLNPHQ